jgi:hypothetical protein
MAAAEIGKLIPPDEVISAELEQELVVSVREQVTARILREANAEAQIAAALAAIERPDAETMRGGIEALFVDEPEAEWRKHVRDVTADLTGADSEKR